MVWRILDKQVCNDVTCKRRAYAECRIGLIFADIRIDVDGIISSIRNLTVRFEVQRHTVIYASPLFTLRLVFLMFRGKLGSLYAIDPLSDLHFRIPLVGSSVELLYEMVGLLALSSIDQCLSCVHRGEQYYTS